MVLQNIFYNSIIEIRKFVVNNLKKFNNCKIEFCIFFPQKKKV